MTLPSSQLNCCNNVMMKLMLDRPTSCYYNKDAYDKRLIECEHHDEFDAQELSQGTAAFKFLACQAVEDKKTIKGNPTFPESGIE